jgi:hypothetical protein
VIKCFEQFDVGWEPKGTIDMKHILLFGRLYFWWEENSKFTAVCKDVISRLLCVRQGDGIDCIFDRHILSYAADLRRQSRGGNATIKDVRCAERLEEFGVLERSSGDDGRKPRKFRKLDS